MSKDDSPTVKADREHRLKEEVSKKPQDSVKDPLENLEDLEAEEEEVEFEGVDNEADIPKGKEDKYGI